MNITEERCYFAAELWLNWRAKPVVKVAWDA